MTPTEILKNEAEWKERATVSPNQINAFTQCPLKWYAQSVLRPPRGIPPAPLVLGSTVDAALTYFAKGHVHHNCWRFAVGEHKIYFFAPESAKEAYAQFHRGILMMPDPNDWSRAQVEVFGPCVRGLRLHGFVDLLFFEHCTETLVIRDWKTSKRTPTLRPVASGISVQLGVYALCVMESGLQVVEQAKSIRLEYAMTRTGKVHTFEPTEAEFVQLRFFLDHTLDRMVRAFDAPLATPNRLCDWCQFKPKCPAHVELDINEETLMGILDKIRPAADQTAQFLNLLVYGAPGSGKTFLAGTAATAGIKTLVLDVESGSMTIRDTDADVLTIKSTQDVKDAYKEIQTALELGTFGYDLVVLDSLTEIQKLHIDELSGQGKTSLKIQQWGTVIDTTRRIVRAFRDLPCHCLILALSKEISDDGGDGATVVRVRPAVNGSTLPHELGGFFDIVGYSGVTEGGYRIAFRGSERVMAKDRSQRLSPMEPNDFGRIHGKIFGTWEEPEEAEEAEEE